MMCKEKSHKICICGVGQCLRVERKTSAQWNKEDGVVILDPDGWDRKDFQYSFHQELITKREYHNRLLRSTIKMEPHELL